MTFHQLPQSAAMWWSGAGMHGMSTAWHLAMALEKSGRGRGSDVVLIDKSGPGAGATGIACGCVRNLYMTGRCTILKHSVDVWQSDPVNFGFQQVGYVSVGESNQQTDYETMHQSQNASGYPSDLYVGQDAKRFLKACGRTSMSTRPTWCCTRSRRAMPAPTPRCGRSRRNATSGACARSWA
jgi:methylglutamate dehydrogenase subunit A